MGLNPAQHNSEYSIQGRLHRTRRIESSWCNRCLHQLGIPTLCASRDWCYCGRPTRRTRSVKRESERRGSSLRSALRK